MFFKKTEPHYEPAPDFMSKHIAGGTLTDEGEFNIYFGGWFSKSVFHSFHVLFYVVIKTQKKIDNPTFICLDKVGGGIFFIEFESDHTDNNCYDIINHYEKISYEAFGKIVQDIDAYLPGLKETFGHLSENNWKDFLTVQYNQPQDIDYAFLVTNKKGENIEFIRYSANTVEYCICDKSDYNKWVDGRKYVSDDYLLFHNIIEFAKYHQKKSCGLIVRLKLFKKVLKMINTVCNEKLQDGKLDLIVVHNKRFRRIEQNVGEAQLEELFEEIKKDLL